MPNPNLPDMIKQRQQLNQQILDSVRAVRAQVQEIATRNNMSIEDIMRIVSSEGDPLYIDSEGNTWCGRGRKPVWLRDAEAAGVNIEDFRVGGQNGEHSEKESG